MTDVSMNSPILSLDQGVDFSVGRDRVVNFYKSFRSEMADIMKELMDPNADLVIGGVKIASDQKTGTAATYLLNEWQDEQSFTFSQLLDAYKFQQTLESKLNNVVGA
jgi:hypothetical protein